MADVIIKILTPATTFDLMTLAELKAGLGIGTGDTSEDAALTELIHRYSDYISEVTNRVFAKERVQETWRELQSRRVFLSHWPVKESDIESVEVPRGSAMDPVNWELEEKSGKLSIFAPQPEPIVVTYTGGFNLPGETPPALKQAMEIFIRGERTTAQQASTAGIKSVSHRESRVMFFDPNQGGGGSSGGGGSKAGGFSALQTEAMRSFLLHYTRLQV